MPLMPEFTEIVVEEGLLPQIVRELLAMTDNPNYVEVVHGTVGRVILAHPELAEAWYQKVTKEADKPADVPIPIPVQRKKGSPRNIPSASPDSEES